MSNASDVNQLIRRLRRAGCSVTSNGKGHYVARDENGRYITTISRSPSDSRWLQNALASIKRSGIVL